MTSAIAKEVPPYRLDTVNSRHAGGERFRVHVLGRFRLLGGDTPVTRRRGTRNSRPRIVRSLPLHLSGNAAGGDLCIALFPKEDPENSSAGFGFGA